MRRTVKPFTSNADIYLRKYLFLQAQSIHTPYKKVEKENPSQRQSLIADLLLM